MDLHSGLPFWPLLHGIIHTYPSLQRNVECQVAVIGGGITGAMIAWHLVREGYDVNVFDRRHIGMGSTAASTALLQYELDTSLTKLIQLRGRHIANRSYLLCEEAIPMIGALCKEVGADPLFMDSGSLQFASYKKDLKWMKEEVACRKKIGINVTWFDESDLMNRYGFRKPGGIFSETGAGLDAYALCHRLLQHRGLRVYDHTDILEIEFKRNHVILLTRNNKKIKAGRLIIAGGYESQKFLSRNVENLYSTYAIISEPLEDPRFWYRNSLIWETANPYLYIRQTRGGRIAIGGKDTKGSDPNKRYELLPTKKKQLKLAFEKLFPHIPISIDFAWAGSFATTRDGLPYIGVVKECPHTFFVMGLGGNGIPFTMVATQLVSKWLKGKDHSDFQVFSFDR